MPTVQVTANLPTEALLQAIEQLDEQDLDTLLTRMLALRARRRARGPQTTEAELLQKINRRLPPEVQARYEDLIVKRDDRTLSSEEYGELLQLSDRAEQADVERLGALIELAQFRQVSLDQLRQVSLDQLLRDLGLEMQSHG